MHIYQPISTSTVLSKILKTTPDHSKNTPNHSKNSSKLHKFSKNSYFSAQTF